MRRQGTEQQLSGGVPPHPGRRSSNQQSQCASPAAGAAPAIGAGSQTGDADVSNRTVIGSVQPRPRSALRAVAVPSEHGGWGLTAEPVLLGLLVAPSVSGALLGAGALVAFLARTPLKLVLVDRWRHRRFPRTVLAGRLAAGELALLAMLMATVAIRTGWGWWAPLGAAVPLIAVEMWFDMRSRSRRLVPELCGAIGIASVASAIARAGGASWAVSLGLWVVLSARSVTALPFVRAQVLRLKGRQAQTAGVAVAGAVAIALVVGGWSAGLVPLAPVIALVALVIWGLWSLRRPPPSVAVLGASQVVLGVGVVLVTAITVRPW